MENKKNKTFSFHKREFQIIFYIRKLNNNESYNKVKNNNSYYRKLVMM